MRIRIACIDLNGTLVNDWLASYAGVRAIFDKHGLPCPTLATYVTYVAKTGEYLDFYGAHGVANIDRDALYATYLPAYIRELPAVTLMEGTEQVLLALRSSNIATHVVTSARTDFAELLLDHGGIRELVDEVHASSHNKARTFTSILERTGCEPTECVMLGDLPSDVQYAKQAGIVGIGLMNSHVPREVFQTVTDMDYFALHLKGFLGYVETLHVYSQRG